ncbi:LysM peptidoglycan-binding domain-containing protein [Chromobacterium alticapitis]|nr:LysM peptidoglycan-binding domain-containing protein [Chromobacterium alticapitis]
MPRGNYEYRYLALDAAGNIQNSGQGQMALNDSAPTLTPVLDSQGRPLGADKAFVTADGLLNVTGLKGPGGNATHGLVRFRSPPGSGAWTQAYNVSVAAPAGITNGWFAINTAALGLKPGARYEYDLQGLDAGGKEAGRVVGSFAPGEANTLGQPVPWSSQAQIIHLSNQSSLAASGVVRYRLADSKGEYISQTLRPGDGSGRFDWDTGEDGAPAGNYDFEYQVFDAGGAMINRQRGQMTLGLDHDVQVDQNSGLVLPLYVQFNPAQSSAARLDVSYRLKGSNAKWQDAHVPRNGKGNFLLNVDDWQEGDYEYRFVLRDAAGALINGADGAALETRGYLHRGSNSSQLSSNALKWVVDKSLYNATVTRRQAYNAFGEVVSETDGVGHTTTSDYDTAGKLVAKHEARVMLRDDNGNVLKNADGSDKLGGDDATQYRYDAMGNLVSTIDANNHENRQRWLAGSQDSQGKVLREYHADGSTKEMAYDRLGNLRFATVNGDHREDYQYDKLGQLTRADHAQRSTASGSENESYGGQRRYDSYAYDGAGHRISHSTTSTGRDTLTDTTRYDSLGRVLGAVSAAQRHTDYSYVWDAQLKGAGGIVVGGWRTTTTNANQMTLQDATTLSGLKVAHRDLGGRVSAYDYNNAGQLTHQYGDNTGPVKNAQDIVYTYYGNGYLQGMEDTVAQQYTLYGYDDDGRKTYEAYANGPDRDHLSFYQQAKISYDERGRVIDINDSTRFHSRYWYDAVGNRQRVYTEYQDGKDGSKQTQDNWYDYDAMNRFTVTMGSHDAQGNLVLGSRGVRVEYDRFGQRAKVTNGVDGTVETYSYTADGLLLDTQISASGKAADAKLAYHRVNDLLGRVTSSHSYNWLGGNSGKDSQTVTTYDADNKVTRQAVDGKGLSYQLMNDGTLQSTQQDGETTLATSFDYEWWDEAKQSTITTQATNANAPGWKPGVSHLSYDANGHLKEVIDDKDDPVNGHRHLRYITDAQGVVVRREEIDQQSTYKKQDYYYVDGKQVGAVGNDGPVRGDFAQALAQAKLGSDKDQYRFGKAVSSADFDQNYEPIGPNNPAQAPGSVTVRAGDSLQSLAGNLWGDRSLWYLLADANGLSGNEQLAAGQVLKVPNKVTNFHNNSSTYRVYNPGEAMGDVTPTLPDAPPPPASDGGCGGFGMILVIVIVIVVAYIVGPAVASWLSGGSSTAAGAAGATAAGSGAAASGTAAAGSSAAAGGTVTASGAAGATAAGATAGTSAAAAGTASFWATPVLGSSVTYAGVAGAMVGGAAGSIAGQGAAMAMGMQDRFSWEQVGLSALTAGAMRYTGGVNFFANQAYNSVAQAMAGSALSQGLAMATGLQKSFNWAAVGASGVAEWAAGTLPQAGLQDRMAYGMARGLIGGTIQSVVGEDHKPNWSDLALQSFGSAVGDQITSSIQAGEQARLDQAGREVNAIEGMYASSQKSMLEGLMSLGGGSVGDSGYWASQEDFGGDGSSNEASGGASGGGDLPQRAQAGKADTLTAPEFNTGDGISHGSHYVGDNNGVPLFEADPIQVTAYGHTRTENLEHQRMVDLEDLLDPLYADMPIANIEIIGGSQRNVASTPAIAGGDNMREIGGLEALWRFSSIGRFARGFGSGLSDVAGSVDAFMQDGFDRLESKAATALGIAGNEATPARSAFFKSVDQNGWGPTLLVSGVEAAAAPVQLLAAFGRSAYQGSPEGLGRATSELAIMGLGARLGAVGRPGSVIGDVADSALAKATNRVAVKGEGSYGDLVGTLDDGFQAHHLNQNAAFNSVIPKDEGFSIGIRGNAFTEAGTPHYDFHSSLERFWDSYRKGGDLFGEVPTNAQYGDAVTQALRDSGLSESEAQRLSDLAKQNRHAFGLRPEASVPRVPRKIYQSGGN